MKRTEYVFCYRQSHIFVTAACESRALHDEWDVVVSVQRAAKDRGRLTRVPVGRKSYESLGEAVTSAIVAARSYLDGNEGPAA